MSRLSRRRQRVKQVTTDLDITAFMNLMVILVPFLLITAVFSQITVLDLFLPPATSTESGASKKTFQLDVVIRQDYIEIFEQKSGLTKIIAKQEGNHDFNALSQALVALQEKFPDKKDATILSELTIKYDTLVKAMDHVRMVEISAGGDVSLVELFPNISIGDAPARNKK